MVLTKVTQAMIEGQGTAAVEDVGVADGNVIQADSTGLPVIDGSQLTGISAGLSLVSRKTLSGSDVSWTDLDTSATLYKMVMSGLSVSSDEKTLQITVGHGSTTYQTTGHTSGLMMTRRGSSNKGHEGPVTAIALVHPDTVTGHFYASSSYYGMVEMALCVDGSSNHFWVFSWSLAPDDVEASNRGVFIGGGGAAMAANPLTALKLLTSGTFDAGLVSLYSDVV